MSGFPPVRKAVFPVAGLGTRFLPATKAVPKELLPVLDKPLIQFAVDEAVEAGIETLIFVNHPSKQAIVRHFLLAHDLEQSLQRAGKTELLEIVASILPQGIRLEETIQEQPLGLGHAIWCARDLVGNEPFAVLLPDDLMIAEGQGALGQMMDVYRQTGSSVMCLESVDPGLTDRYGIAETTTTSAGHVAITSLVEKPSPEEAPSNLGVVGRYILSGEIFKLLENIGKGAGGEIQLTDGIEALIAIEPVLAHTFLGTRYDCGSKLGMVKANIDLALAETDIREAVLSHIKSKLNTGA